MRTIHRINREYSPKNTCNVATEVVAAGVGALGTIGGATVSGVGQSTMNKATREFNKEEAEKARLWSEKMYNDQNAWNYRMWNEENAYNTPAAQVQRLREAGLNPLYYGLDGSSAQGVSAAQPLGYERASVGAFANPWSGAEDVGLKIAQIANIQADTAKKNNENLTETQKREKLLADIETTKQQLNNLKAQEGLTKSQKEEIDQRISWTDRLNEATLAEKQANAALNESQKKRIEELLEGEKIMQVKEFEDFDRKWKKIDAEIAKMAQETGLAKLDIENYSLNHLSNGVFGSGISLQNILRGWKDNIPAQWTDEGDDMDPMALARAGQ